MKALAILQLMRSGLISRTLLAGVALAFIGLSLLGRQVSRENYHPNFTRITQWISPETKYYMTVDEMIAIVRSKAKPGQILVIIGGNSVLRGVGQPADKLWSLRLQENLGPGYCVVNLAFNGSLITDGASVVAEALRKEFPRQIYLANAAPTQSPTVGGSNYYRFVYWDAYYKRLLIDDPERNAVLTAQKAVPNLNAGLQELKIRSWLNSRLYFGDFWNKVTYETVNTIWAPWTPGPTRFLTPRREFPDPEPDFLQMTWEQRYVPANLEIEMINVRGNSITAYRPQKDANGKWVLYEPVWNLFKEGIKGTVPPELRKRTLILLGRTSPVYRSLLKPDEVERDDLAYAKAVDAWEEVGFAALDFGRDFTRDEYGDRTHLTHVAGAKLATLVAAKIRSMSAELGYLKP
jgi:hypothetical protein